MFNISVQDFRLNGRRLASGAKPGFPNTHIFASLYLAAIKRESLSLFFVFRQFFAAMWQVSGHCFIFGGLFVVIAQQYANFLAGTLSA